MASWDSEPTRPRSRGGALSVRYIGVIMTAAPAANPTMTRITRKAMSDGASAVATAPRPNSTPSQTSDRLRPRRSASRPPKIEPMIAPTLTAATATPISAAESLNSFARNDCAPAMMPRS